MMATCVLAAATPAAAQDRAPVVLSPSSEWAMEYADDSCRLARMFGTGESQTILYFERFEPGNSFTLLVAGAPLKARRDTARTTFHFGPAGRDYDGSWTPGSFGQFDPALIVSSTALFPFKREQESEPHVDPSSIAQDRGRFRQWITPEQEESIRWLEIRRAGMAPVRLELGSLGAPFAAMRTCTDELLTHWGIDVAAHRDLTRAAAPKNSPARWLGPNDYPTHLLLKGAQGLVHFRLMIGPDGQPTDCVIQRSTRPEGFDQAVCRALMRKARFTPALDAQGKPVASYWLNTVRFEIPG